MKKQDAELSGTLKEEFRKDLDLFAHLLVLLNQSSPIRNVELMWAEDLEFLDPTQRRRMSTSDALVRIGPEMPGGGERTGAAPSTHFCDLVHGFGAWEEQTCARSDEPAKERCRGTGVSQVYPCHVGLTDIAVPVVCEGRFLGTLFSGQVLTEAPTTEGFARVREALAGNSKINLEELEEAYYRVPVVSDAQIAQTVQTLEVFARYLANAWKRLEIMGEFQRVREREQALDRRELVEMLLSREIGRGGDGYDVLRARAAKAGLKRLPNRVLVLRMQSRGPATAQGSEEENSNAIHNHLAWVRAGHMVEDCCRNWPNTLSATAAPGEICVMTAQDTEDEEKSALGEIVRELMRLLRAQGLVNIRAGISGPHEGALELWTAYQEAQAALDGGHGSVHWFITRKNPPEQALRTLQEALQTAQAAGVARAVRDFLMVAAPASATVAQLPNVRGMLTWACEHLARELTMLGIEGERVDAEKARAEQMIVELQSSAAMADAFRRFAEQMRVLVAETFSRREEKIVLQAQRLAREIGPAQVSIQLLAEKLEISQGHLSRVFSGVVGTTLEEYLIQQRVEMAKRLLLDPRLRIAEVASRCGFCNPGYFSAVFRKHAGCTPRAYARNPQIESGPAGARLTE
jgi:AraC-like DNA-binding protein/ligand-binding sensor protein